MATSTSKSVDSAATSGTVLKPISPTLRKRLQKYYGYGTQKQKEGDYDYAHAMFSQCVVADPANILYVESMLNNLIAKYRGKKKKPKVRANRNAFKKAIADEEWVKVLKQGPEFLEQSPWDVQTLRGMADACAALRQGDERFNDIELRYLRTALDANPKDIEVNKHCAESLARMGQFDQAIACWHRIEELAPSKEGAHKRISELTVLKNMRASGLLAEDKSAENASTKSTENKTAEKQSGKASDKSKEESAADTEETKSASNKNGTTKNGSTTEGKKKDTVDGLEQAIAQDPAEVSNYLALSKLYEAKGELADAERVLRRASSVSGNDLKISERLETVQVRRSRRQLATAEAQFKATPNDDNRELVQRMKTELNRLELGIYNSRAQRYPDQKQYQFELAVCLKRAGKFKEAAKYFKESATDPKILPTALLQRGECLQQVRQYQEAMRCYTESSKAAANESDKAKSAAIEQLALYRAGVLAMGLKDQHQALKLLEQLAAQNADFRDVNARLDKLKNMGDN